MGRKALRKMYDAIVLESPTLPPGVHLDDIYKDHPDARLFKFDDAMMLANRVAQLHIQLRGHCDMLGVGAAGAAFGGKKDTSNEDKTKEGRDCHYLTFLTTNVWGGTTRLCCKGG